MDVMSETSLKSIFGVCVFYLHFLSYSLGDRCFHFNLILTKRHCTYCVVPSVRGVEQSRSMEAILQECLQLASSGYTEVTLLGQNIDAYGYVTDLLIVTSGDTFDLIFPSSMAPSLFYSIVMRSDEI